MLREAPLLHLFLQQTVEWVSRECESFVHALSTMLAEKRDESLSSVINWFRTKISFALTRSTVLCIRGTRCLRIKPITTESDIGIVEAMYV